MSADGKGLLTGGPVDAFSEGAARFDRMIEAVKSSQAAKPVETQAAQAANPLLSVSPGEEWSRRFQSEGFGPETRGMSFADLAAVPRDLVMPPSVSEVAPTRSQEFAPKPVFAPSGPLGEHLGKAERPRRSWLGRMLHRS